jgi:multidrug resistance efflux pump
MTDERKMGGRRCGIYAALTAVAMFAGCSRDPVVTHAAIIAPQSEPVRAVRQIRSTGTIQAEKAFTVQVPQIAGQAGRLTLVGLAESGARVKAGETVAEFDRTQQIDNARDTQAKFDDLTHQVEQKQAEFRSNAEKRKSDLQKAEADLAKARLQLRRGPLLSDIDRLKNEVKAEQSEAQVDSLKRSNHSHDVAEAANIRVLELQRDRQKVGLDRALGNAERLVVKAPLAGMVALENVWRGNGMGKPLEGDQLFTGQPIMRIFDPTQMVVDTVVGEPDGAILVPEARAKVRLDAYPELIFDAHFVSASPVAASAVGAPIKTFSARFRLEQVDPHLLPDLSAAIIVLGHEER